MDKVRDNNSGERVRDDDENDDDDDQGDDVPDKSGDKVRDDGDGEEVRDDDGDEARDDNGDETREDSGDEARDDNGDDIYDKDGDEVHGADDVVRDDGSGACARYATICAHRARTPSLKGPNRPSLCCALASMASRTGQSASCASVSRRRNEARGSGAPHSTALCIHPFGGI